MYRVVTDIRNHRGQRVLEPGPWHPKKEDAEHWIEVLQALGYKTHIERMNGNIAGGAADDGLAHALENMA